MNRNLLYLLIAAVATIGLAPLSAHAQGEQPTRFEYTPKFKDPDPGMRTWTRNGSTWTEELPSGAKNTFLVKKPTRVNGLHGTLVQKVKESNLFVFVPNTRTKQRMDLYFWRDKGPWVFLGEMKNASAPSQY